MDGKGRTPRLKRPQDHNDASVEPLFRRSGATYSGQFIPAILSQAQPAAPKLRNRANLTTDSYRILTAESRSPDRLLPTLMRHSSFGIPVAGSCAVEQTLTIADIREPDRFGQLCAGYLPLITKS
jgi:hypothetical protein